jgi:hypothetical protein
MRADLTFMALAHESNRYLLTSEGNPQTASP